MRLNLGGVIMFMCGTVRDEVKRWLSEAEWDLGNAEILYREGRWNATAFYSHQAGEKAVKALLYSVNEAPWGHSVRILLERYFKKAGVGRDEGLLRCARELDMHYVLSRYPNAHPAGTPHEAYDEATARKALNAARRIIEYVKEVLRA